MRWTYTRYSRVADEEQKKVSGGDCLLKLSEGGNFKKEFGKHVVLKKVFFFGIKMSCLPLII